MFFFCFVLVASDTCDNSNSSSVGQQPLPQQLSESLGSSVEPDSKRRGSRATQRNGRLLTFREKKVVPLLHLKSSFEKRAKSFDKTKIDIARCNGVNFISIKYQAL